MADGAFSWLSTICLLQHVRLVVDDCTCSGAGKCVHKAPEPTRNTVLHFSNNGYTYRGVDPNIPKPRSLKPGVEPLEQRCRGRLFVDGICVC